MRNSAEGAIEKYPAMADAVHLARRWGNALAVDLYRRYEQDVRHLQGFNHLIPAIGKSYQGEERRLLYLMTRFCSPDLIIEFSPKRGWSTLHMATALEHNGRGRIISFELDPVYARLTKRTLDREGLAHRADVVVGDVREEFPKVYDRLKKAEAISGLEFLFIDSDHSTKFARWYLANLFPLVKQHGVIHVHDFQAAPESVLAGERIFLPPSGEEIALAEYLLQHREEFRWFSVAELVRDSEYLAAVQKHGGGDLTFSRNRTRLHPVDIAIGFERNPSLWLLNLGAQETTVYPGRPFEPLKRTKAGALAYGTRKRLAFFYAPLREMRRSLKRK